MCRYEAQYITPKVVVIFSQYRIHMKMWKEENRIIKYDQKLVDLQLTSDNWG